MKRATDTKTLIRKVYPGNDEAIERGLAQHPAFRELCEDYRRCAVALEAWQQATDVHHPERVREYEELLAGLARELEGWIGVLSEESLPPDAAERE